MNKKYFLKISKHRFCVKISKEDVVKYNKHIWRITYTHDLFYVYTYIRVDKKTKAMFLHRYLTNCPKGLVIDHINGNGLDNTRKNLRICTHRENLQNQSKKRRNASSKYKGVCWATRDKVWRAYIKKDYKRVCIGSFKTERDAALAYNKKAKEIFGKYSKLNSIK